MPRRSDLQRILLIGAGPIVIGQASEFDYSGTQGAKALRDEGFDVVLVNSNPATIMTDPQLAARTYIEPLEWRALEAIIQRERPQALLPTLGGQTALNLALKLREKGVLERYGVEMLGARADSIEKAEDRALFKAAMEKIGLTCPKAGVAHSIEEAWQVVRVTGFPAILRPSFTMGGSGGGIAYTEGEFVDKVSWALTQSPTHEVLIEESVLGWKEFELEVMRDRADNFIVVCSIENIDPMGVHTGDSITCAPAMTLTDREFQRLRDAARAVMTEIGVETGGANVQFAVDPRSGRFHVIEMNPRVSRSSALASKATGYPIAKIAAKLAVGYTLDELKNDITATSAAFEPVIDYVVVKWPRFAFEKFPGSDTTLGTQMKSVGEAMSIGRTFCEALQKAARSLETGRDGMASLLSKVDYRLLAEPKRQRDLGMEAPEPDAPRTLPPGTGEEVRSALEKLVATPTADRLFYVADAMRVGFTDEELFARTAIDPWFLAQLRRIVDAEAYMRRGEIEPWQLRRYKRLGFSDRQTAVLTGSCEDDVRALRLAGGVRAVYGRVDTCAAEFKADTPYFYSTYETESEARPTRGKRKVIILGGGPNRIGQGIEFDYCCVHAVMALRELGCETIMVNCNPETVSTDYDASDRLYFEPLTLEDVLGIVAEEEPEGVVVQFGGQTPLKLAVPLEKHGVRLLGTGADAIDRAEDRERFDQLLTKLSLKRPRSGIARTPEQAVGIAEAIGFPVLVRPSYVLGGRAMMIAYSRDELAIFATRAFEAASETGAPTILVDEVSQGRHRGRRRLHRRRKALRDRRGDAAHRGSGRSFRRQYQRASSTFAIAGDRAQHRRAVPDAGARAGRGGSDERAVRRQGRGDLHPRGQSPRQPHGPLRVQSDGAAARKDCCDAHGRQDARRARYRRCAHAPSYERQRERLPICEVPRCRHHPRPGDAVHRRSDGDSRDICTGLRQIDAGERDRARRAGPRQQAASCVRERQGRGQACGHPHCSASPRSGLRPRRDRGDCQGPFAGAASYGGRQEGQRGIAARGRRAPQRDHRHRGQHRHRSPRSAR